MIEDPLFGAIDYTKAQLCAAAEDAIYANYLEERPDLRKQFGNSADELMPIIADKTGLVALLTPISFLIDRPLKPDERVVGLLYDCTWAPGHLNLDWP